MEALTKIKPRRLKWFENRIGTFVIKNSHDLFNPPVLITSKQHAKALYITQKEKNYTFNQ